MDYIERAWKRYVADMLNELRRLHEGKQAAVVFTERQIRCDLFANEAEFRRFIDEYVSPFAAKKGARFATGYTTRSVPAKVGKPDRVRIPDSFTITLVYMDGASKA